MSIDCHLYAVDANDVPALKVNPELAIGTAALRGLPSCNLHKAWHAIHFLLTGRADESVGPAAALLCGGVELGKSRNVDEEPPRLLTPLEVKAFHEVLKPLDEAAVYRRFNPSAMAAADIYSIHGSEADWSDEESWDDVFAREDLDDGSDDWSLDQAEDYEFVAHYFEELRTFIARTAASGWGIVITLN